MVGSMDVHKRRFLQASHFLIGLPGETEGEDDLAEVLPYFALVGLALGVLTIVLVAFTAPTGAAGRGFVAALLVTLLWVLVSRAQNLVSLPPLMRLVLLRSGSERASEVGEYSGQVLMFGVVIVKLAAVWWLATAGHWRWFLLVPTLSVLFTVEMAMAHELLGSEHPQFGRNHRIFLLLVLVVCLLGGDLRGMVVGVGVWLLTYAVRDWSREWFAELPEDWINGGAEVVECLVLVLGLILLSGGTS